MAEDSYQYTARLMESVIIAMAINRHGDQSQRQSKEVTDVDRLPAAVCVLIQPDSVAPRMK
jgi:hypothetical protein